MVVCLLNYTYDDFTKFRLENAASKALGLDVHISGKIKVSVLPDLHIRLRDVRLGNHGQDVATISDTNLHLAVLPLFKHNIVLRAFCHELVTNGLAFSNININLAMLGKTRNQLLRSAVGDVTFSGKNMTLQGRDLDLEFSRFKSSQNFNMFDAGAYFFLGPLGLAVTKGYNFARANQDSTGSSAIVMLYSSWKIEHGLAEAEDVAMTTKHNRLAMKGTIDLVNERFNNITLALIDDKGRAIAKQEISGPFAKPVVKKQAFLKSLAGPAVNLLKKGASFFGGAKGEIFYSGSVPAPEK